MNAVKKIEKIPIPEFDSGEKTMIKRLMYIIIQNIIKGGYNE